MKPYGKGTITELIKGKKYRIALSAGKDPITGKYRRHQETFLGTKRQAELRIEEIRREINCGKIPNADKMKFEKLCEMYLSKRENLDSKRPKTLKQDRSLSKHLLRGLGSMRVADITTAMIDDLYIKMRQDGIGDTTIRQVHKLLKRVLDYGMRNGVIVRNPADFAEQPKKPKPQREALTISESNRLTEICTSGTPTANKVAVYLGLALGARLGEVLGIQWRHVSLNGNPSVTIVQQFTSTGKIAPLKTDKDDSPTGRTIPIDTHTAMMLSTWKATQRKQLNELGIEQGNDTPVITNQLGAFVNHSRFERWWRSFCVDNGFGKWTSDDGRSIVNLVIGDDTELFPPSDYVIQWRDADGWPCDADGRRYSRTYKQPKAKKHYHGLHYHELRHTHFTYRIALEKMDIPTAQYLGGWSSPDVLLKHYAHATPESVWQSVGFMDRLAAMKVRC